MLNGERRDSERAPVAIIAMLRRQGRTAYQVKLRDLSRNGCRAETLSRIIIGDHVWVTIPGFTAIEGTVRWTDKINFGIEWEKRIHPSVFEHIRTNYPDAF
jgi:hypothetical protein